MNIEDKVLAHSLICLRVTIFLLKIAGGCFQTGSYYGHVIDFQGEVFDAEDCQEFCQLSENCHFWTYNYETTICYRQDIKAPENAQSCDECTRGPKECTREYMLDSFLEVTLKPNDL